MEAGNANKRFVFYGAGKYAKANLNRLISAGYAPLCFVDSDKNKHNTLFGDTGITIASLDSALAEYPDCRFLLTVGVNFYREVHEHLRNRGIAENRIEHPEEVAYRKSCSLFYDKMLVNSDAIHMCCHRFQEWPREPAFFFPFDIALDGSLASAMNAYGNARAVLLERWANEEKSPCDGCPYLKHDWYEKTDKIRVVLIGGGYGDETCNFSCVYCIDSETVNKGVKKAGLRDVIMKLTRYIDCRDVIFSLISGEFLTRRDCDEILQFLCGKGAKISLTSNSSIYSETLASFIREGRVIEICTSLDAGTAATFAKVKNTGVDYFRKTVNNISRYSGLGCRYYLKYLFLPGINDNEDDINGFVDICNAIRPVGVHISADVCKKNIRFERRTMDMVFLLHDKLAERGLRALWLYDDFNVDDMKIIRSRVGERM